MSVQRPLRPRSAMTPCWSTESLRAKRTGGRGDAIEAKAGGERYSSRGLLLLRLRAGRPIPIVILGLVLGAEKGSDINVSRALAPAGCAGRAGVAAVIFGGVRMGAPELVDRARRRRHRRDPLQDRKCAAC